MILDTSTLSVGMKLSKRTESFFSPRNCMVPEEMDKSVILHASFTLKGVHAVTQTFWDSRDCKLQPGSSVHGISSGKNISWGVLSCPYSRISPDRRPCLLLLLHWQADSFHWASWEAHFNISLLSIIKMSLLFKLSSWKKCLKSLNYSWLLCLKLTPSFKGGVSDLGNF